MAKYLFARDQKGNPEEKYRDIWLCKTHIFVGKRLYKQAQKIKLRMEKITKLLLFLIYREHK